MARTQVQYGSQGNDVKTLQEILNKNGYSLDADGIFGSKTQAAVKDYQQKNGLDVDGIVGVNTWASLDGGSSATNTKDTSPKFEYEDFSYKDYEEGKTVTESKNALDAHLKQEPGEYKSQWQAQLDETMNKILNREDFSYDFNGDALYQQYKDKYIKQGKMAMEDTIGQASAMTGGYGNSYAQTVGNQAYQASLEQLNDVVPELYQMAYDRYNQEGQDLYNQYAMLGEQESQDYGRYRDQVGDWKTERDYLAGRYDSEREYDYSKYADERTFEYGKYSDDKSYAYQDHRNAIADQQWQAEFDEAKRQYNEQMDFQKQQYNDSKSYYSGGSGGSSSGGSSSGSSKGTKADGSSYDNGSLSSSQIKELQNALGVEADGKYGSNSQKAAGGLSAEEAYNKYVGKGGSGFTGSTYEDAVSYAESKGVPAAHASGIMTLSEWSRRRSSYQATGQGGAEAKNYSSYKEYLADITEYLVEKYN